MSRFRYSDDEMDINKVLKMNQDTSDSLLGDSDLKASRSAADSNIDASLELLRSLGKEKEIHKLSTEMKIRLACRILCDCSSSSKDNSIVSQRYADFGALILSDLFGKKEE